MASFGSVMSYIGYVLLAVLILLVMITVHELGHFIAGKILGFSIEEFSIGFGPHIFQKEKKNGEKFSVRIFPLGGYCAFTGEDKDDSDPKAFNNQKPLKRIIVLISGVLMNYILALLIIFIMFSAYGRNSLVTFKTDKDSSYSVEQSFKDYDAILKINGKNVYMSTDIMSALEGKKQGDKVNFTLYRNGSIGDYKITLRGDADFKNVEDVKTLYSVLGVYYQEDSEGNITDSGFRQTFIKTGFFDRIGMTFEYSFKLASSIFVVIGQLFSGALGLNSVGGTLTTVKVTAKTIQTGGIRYFLNISAFIGVNLAVFNILPIPALDGSRVVFTFIEWIRKKPINRKVENIIHTVGFILILLFAVLVDLQQCF